MTREDDPTRTSTSSSDVDPALDATVPSPGATPTSHLANEQLHLGPGAKIGRYEIGEVLGTGGMGAVYRARDPDLDRDLAIKVVLPTASSARAQQRLLDEARAMAKLRHPAIVPVFDVGTTDRGVYVVMPLVKGGTMYDWLRAEPRTWRESLTRFVTAGRGLSAAHAAGLVHRDFKPRNVLIGDSGEVMVADFGIAAQANVSVESVGGVPTPGSASASSIAGTPAYMAPEQAEGTAVDARADQYSFCISLWEALCGERPTNAETRTRVVALRPLLSKKGTGRGVPTWLLLAVARGFSTSPAERWPSVDALLDHIEARLRRPRRIATTVGIMGVVAVAATAVFVARGTNAEACPDPAARLAKVWSPSVRAQIEVAFRATNAAYADDSFQRVSTALDRFATEWRSTHVQACRAGVVERTQSSELYDRRMLCLDRQLDAVRSKVTALREIDDKTLPRAIELASSLPNVQDCADAALLAQVPPPADPSVRAKMVDLEQRVRDVEILSIRGTPKEALERASSLAAEARALGHAPTLVLALRALTTVEELNRNTTEATLRELATAASEAKDDSAVATAWARLVYQLSEQRRFEEARALEPVAEAALVRAGSPPDLVFRVRTAQGSRASRQAELANAIKRFEEALAAATAPVTRRTALTNLAIANLEAGDLARGLELTNAALAVAEEVYGPHHPSVADNLHMLGQLKQITGDLAASDAALDRAQRIREAAFGESSAQVAGTLKTRAHGAMARGDHAKAEAIARRTIAVYEKENNTIELASAVRLLADAIGYQRGIHEARPHYERALELSLQLGGGKKDLDYIAASLNLSIDLVDIGDCETARRHADNAIEALEALEHPIAAFAFLIRGKCDLAAGQLVEGFEWLQKSVDLCTKKQCSAGHLEETEAYMGQKLVESGRDRRRGIAMVKKARNRLASNGPSEKLEELDKWLAKNDR